MSTDTATGVGHQLTPLVHTYRHELAAIPAPPETFLLRDLPEQTQDLFDRLRENDVIHRVEKDPNAGVYRWRLRAGVAAAVARFEADDNEDAIEPGTRVTPCCQYRGFSNRRDGGFECGRCGSEFEEFAVVEEVADA